MTDQSYDGAGKKRDLGPIFTRLWPHPHDRPWPGKAVKWGKALSAALGLSEGRFGLSVGHRWRTFSTFFFYLQRKAEIFEAGHL